MEVIKGDCLTHQQFVKQLRPDRNLGLELVRATEAAAITARNFIGKGNKNAADGAAVDAMRRFLATVDMQGVVVIGEGEKDNAPMLFNGELVGSGQGPMCDIAVDPIDGTSLAASGRQNALSVIAVTDRGAMLDASSVYYMDKLVAGKAAVGLLDIRLPIGENIRRLAKATNKDVSEIVVACLDRPRHEKLIEEIRAAGASTRLLLDGDVAGGIQAAMETSRIDICVGIGGSPEGIVTTCAIKALGGFIQGILAPRDEQESQKAIAAGLKLDYVYEADEMVNSNNTLFVATGITDGSMLSGVRRKGGVIETDSIILRSVTGTVRRIKSEYQLENLAK
ncbi:MAG: class II fructose-bisphosphatase [Microbacteriaceae bacterium]|nr:class II fructose-bisphosphatase [Microbacteriaceae bacterium]